MTSQQILNAKAYSNNLKQRPTNVTKAIILNAFFKPSDITDVRHTVLWIGYLNNMKNQHLAKHCTLTVPPDEKETGNTLESTKFGGKCWRKSKQTINKFAE